MPGNITKLYKTAGKCDDQHQYKAIIEVKIISTPKGYTEDIPLDVGTFGTLKKPSAGKLISQFLKLLDVTQKRSVRTLGSSKKKGKAILTDVDLWSSVHK